MFTVSVRVTDATGLATVALTTVTVQNVSPTVNAPGVAPAPTGGSVVASATFGDPGENDEPFTCAVDYGDGSGSLPGMIAGSTCTGPAHAYASTGPHTVTVTISDKDGGAGTNSTVVTTYGVTYAGNGATGGGAPSDGNTYVPAALVTVLGDNGLVRTDHAFVGWNTAADGSGTGYFGDATFVMGQANVTLYAQWRAISVIPTLSQWGLALLMLALLGFGAGVARRRN